MNISTPHNQVGPAPRNAQWTDDWQTPPEIVQALGLFDLDPSASMNQIFQTAATMWTIEDQGFLRVWFGRVWLNPPYGNYTQLWVRRLSEHGNGIALVYGRTDTDWFHRYVFARASGIFFFHGRISFIRPDGSRPIHNAGGPSVLVAYGRENGIALERSALAGVFVWLKTG